MGIYMRNKEKKRFGYNNHLLIVISLTRTDVTTIRVYFTVLQTSSGLNAPSSSVLFYTSVMC